MRVEVQDRAGTGARGAVDHALRAALEAFQAAGHGVRRPVRAVLEPLGVPGFTETQVALHVLHLDASAAKAPWLPGLLARQVAHAVLTDEGHPSHDPALLQHSFEAARARSRDLAFLGAVGTLNHHVRDVYADDLAARVAPEALAGFLEHVAGLAARAEGSAAQRAAEQGYALGTLVRRARPAPPALLEAMGPEGRRLGDAFAGLHPEPEAPDLERAVERLVALLPS